MQSLLDIWVTGSGLVVVVRNDLDIVFVIHDDLCFEILLSHSKIKD